LTVTGPKGANNSRMNSGSKAHSLQFIVMPGFMPGIHVLAE